MTSLEKLINSYKDLEFIPVKNYFRIVAPYYHEDGDMYDFFMSISEENHSIKIFDNGLTLMRLSYSFNMDTENKERIFYKILRENYVENDQGNLYIITNEEQFMSALNQMATVISKVTNLEVLNKETINNLFYDYVDDFIVQEIGKSYEVEKDAKPAKVPFFANNYRIKGAKEKEIYIFPVKDNITALRVSTSCATLASKKIDFTSIGVCEDLDILSKTDRYFFLTNIDKSYPALEPFKDEFPSYLERIAS